MPDKVLAGGHTHVQMRLDFDGRSLVNPGSVGSAWLNPPGTSEEVTLQAWAEYCILDAVDDLVRVEMLKVPFDTEEFLKSVEGTDTPVREWWLAQYRRTG